MAPAAKKLSKAELAKIVAKANEQFNAAHPPEEEQKQTDLTVVKLPSPSEAAVRDALSCVHGQSLSSESLMWMEKHAVPQPLSVLGLGDKVLCYDTLTQGLSYSKITRRAPELAGRRRDWVVVELEDGSTFELQQDQLVPCSLPEPTSMDRPSSKASHRSGTALQSAHGLQYSEILHRAGDLEPEHHYLTVLRLQKVPVAKVQRGHLQTVPRDRFSVDVEQGFRHMVFAGGGVPGTTIAVGSAGLRESRPRPTSCPPVFRESAKDQRDREIREASKGDPDLVPLDSMEVSHEKIDAQLQKSMLADCLTAGFWPTKKAIAAIREGSPDNYLVMVALDCPPEGRSEVLALAEAAKVKVFDYPDTSVRLGQALGQTLRVPCTAVTSADDAAIFRSPLERVAEIMEERRLEEERRRARELAADVKFQLAEKIQDSKKETADLEEKLRAIQMALETAQERTKTLEEDLAKAQAEDAKTATEAPAGSGAKAVLAMKKAETEDGYNTNAP